VTDEVMQKMAERLRPPVFKEGFDKITVVRVKGADHPNEQRTLAGDPGAGVASEAGAAAEVQPEAVAEA
jgi:hypothetical protein